MWRRGANLEGDVANFIETEQLLEFEGFRSSFLQIRGSIPLLWEHIVDLSYKPQLKIIDHEQTLIVVERHFHDLVQRYGETIAVDLTDKLSRYLLVDTEGNMLEEQKGIVRSNCIDCLDRTNVTQSYLAQKCLDAQLQRIGVLDSTESISVFDEEYQKFRTLWAGHGDEISLEYLVESSFTIVTDHQPLKHLLDQRLNTPAQHKWLAKLLGYNYKILYRAGHMNTFPDALSRIPEFHSIQNHSEPIFHSLYEIDRACIKDPESQNIITAIQQNKDTRKGFTYRQGRLFYKDRVFVPSSSEWRTKILHESHGSLQAGHSGYICTLIRLRRSFAWPGMHRDVKAFVASCDQCPRSNAETTHPPGLLQPLPIPEKIWTDIAMDFVEGLPHFSNFTGVEVELM